MPGNELFQLTDVWLERPREDGTMQPVLRGLSLAIPGDGITCLIGPSGSGKSTILRLLNRLDDPTRGQIAFRGQELRSLDPMRVRRQVAMVLQTPVMLPGTVRDNLEAGLRIHGQSLSDPGAWLERVELSPDMLNKKARDLSGGEKQRVALARSLATQPEVLLLDEVTASLDAASGAAVEQLVLNLKLPAIWVSHNMEQVRRVAAHVFRLEAGRIQEEVRA
ncbi:MAG: phosphate transporter ATP-binding protein [Firmicutes bacterium]|nr:phosphate transporter ATP-binding protein [Bacillota bacterium]